VEAGDYQGKSPVQSNIDLLNRLHSIELALSSYGPKKYNSIQFFWRGFISSDMADGRWMARAAGCSSAPHEYVGSLPRAPFVNALGIRCFRTDSRTYSTDWSARGRFNFKVTMDSTGVNLNPTVQDSTGTSVQAPYSDLSKNYVCEDSHLTTDDCGDETCSEAASSSDLTIDSLACYDGTAWTEACSGSSVLATFHISGSPSDPCTPPGSPHVDFYGGFTIASNGYVYGDGAVDAFPWFESGVITEQGATSVWNLAPDPGKTAFNLYGGASRVFHISSPF